MTILLSLFLLFPSFLLFSSPASFFPVLFLTGMYHAGLEVMILLVQLCTGAESVHYHIQRLPSFPLLFIHNLV